MLRATFELLPHGDDSKAKRIATIEIANVSDWHPEGLADYDWTIQWRTHDGHLRADHGVIEGWRRSRGALALLGQVLYHSATEEG